MGAPLVSITHVGSLVPLEGTFEVHSVFASAVNLTGTDAYPFALLSDAAHRHPRGAVLDAPADFTAWGLRPGHLGRLTGGRLMFGPGVPAVDFVDAALFDETMPRFVPTLALLDEAAALLQTRQTASQTDLTWAGIQSPRSALERRFADAVALLPRRFEEGGRLLVGLGSGLTPSGDDFLVGWLAAERCLGCAPSPLNGLKAETNVVSAAFLDAAERGLFSSALVGLAQSMVQAQGCAAAFDVLAGVGHSSGLDAATGLIAGLRFLSFPHEVQP
jgi:hypothetical protein